jgi:hypothetical protein
MNAFSKWLVGVAGVGLVACGGNTAQLRRSTATPAAEAQVRSETTDDGNTKLSLEVEHLAPPDRVAADSSVYVVWAVPRTGDRRPQNLGALKVDKNLKGKIETVTPLTDFDVMVTPEGSASVEGPTHEAVLSGGIQK